MASKRQRKQFDTLVSRILLILIGLSSTLVAGTAFYANPTLDGIVAAIGGFLLILGIPTLMVGSFGSDKTACKWAYNTGNHEVLIVYALAAFGIAYVIRKFYKAT
jgi:hypothetical protein